MLAPIDIHQVPRTVLAPELGDGRMGDRHGQTLAAHEMADSRRHAVAAEDHSHVRPQFPCMIASRAAASCWA